LPQLAIVKRNIDDIGAFRFEDFVLTGYKPHAHIAAPVAV
jgi:thymidylate synthase